MAYAEHRVHVKHGGPEDSGDSIQEAVAAIVGDADFSSLRPKKPHGAVQWVRFYAQRIVSNPWFDGFILSLILINSVLLALYEYRDPHCLFNRVSDNIIDPILLAFFTLECTLKVVAWGLVCAISQNNLAYLCDAWNWLDFIVVVTGWISLLADGDGFAFLRVFRVLRPLRSLTMLPDMRVLVNTVLKSIPRLGNVTLMGLFIFTVFSIIGITLWGGIFYRQCRSTQHPTLSFHGDCWHWNVSNGDFLCGGRFECSSGSWCGGHPDDPSKEFRPLFNGKADGHQGLSWCNNRDADIKNPRKAFPETDFIHFDHIGGAMLVIFQSMTMEGWVDIMYWVQDSDNYWVATIFFFLVIAMTSFFVLNVILAVIAEALDDEEEEAEAEEAEEAAQEAEELRLSQLAGGAPPAAGKEGGEEEAAASTQSDDQPLLASSSGSSGCCGCLKRKDRVAPLDENGEPIVKDVENDIWLDVAFVRWTQYVAESEVCKYTVLFFIAANVVVMMMDKFPPDLFLKEFTDACEVTFLAVFGAEMVMMIVALGPVGYAKNPLTAFDGVIVVSSFAELAMSDGGALSVFRTFRLLRVVFKIANRWKAFRVLLKSIVKTIFSLGYFALLFALVLYVLTLMAMSFFATKFHFNEDHSAVLDGGGPSHPWCPGEGQNVDCVPRANFDTFPWAFTTIFQIMSGENWNTVMYDSMRAGPWLLGAGFFVFIIVFGQIMMLNLFLTILMNKFADAADSLDAEEKAKQEKRREAKALAMKSKGGLADLHNDFKNNVDARSSKKVMMGAAAFAFVEPSPTKKIKSSSGDGDSDVEVVEAALPGEKVSQRGKSKETMGMVETVEAEDTMAALEATEPPPDAPTLPAVGEGNTGDASNVELPAEQLALSYAIQDSPGDATSPGAESGASPALCRTTSSMSSKVDSWPRSYALLLFHKENVIRRICTKIIEQKAFDHFILVCILFASLIMAMGSPLLDPSDTSTQIMKIMDQSFAIIFIIEMLLKLVAMGLVYGPNTYLHNAWNWIDGVVVVVSIIGMTSGSSAGFLKTLRILRAFRPLRVISRNENLKVVVTTIFLSLPELAMYLTVFMLFLLILALLFLAYLNGLFYACSTGPGDNMAMTDNIGPSFTTPLCLSPVGDRVCPWGAFDASGDSWLKTAGGCGSCHGGATNITWTRPSADTPICVGRCSPLQLSSDYPPPSALCPPAPTSAKELPSLCPDGELSLKPTPGKYFEAEKVGVTYVTAYLKEHVVPCGGPVAGAGCRDMFCPHKKGKPASDSCKSECKKHPTFCSSTCGKSKTSTACLECLTECEAWCECQDYCEPLVKDAALCVEQGERWGQTISQNFNTIANSLTTLFEISTTEGWVDVMYEATDAKGDYYEHPKRDTSLVWAFIFTGFIFFSNMFFLNLSVGVIVEQFLKIKKASKMVNDAGAEVYEDENGTYYCKCPLGTPAAPGDGSSPVQPPIGQSGSSLALGKRAQKEKGPLCRPEEQCPSCANFIADPMLTDKQAQWYKSQKSLYKLKDLFPLTNLHRVGKWQKKAFLLISSAFFENSIMTAIVLNTMLMAAHSTPQPTEWWDEFKEVCGKTFAAVFFFEFCVKMFALRSNYWKDPWNMFDFFCVVATFVGILLQQLGVGLGAVMSVIRIFRVARLFRLLRFMKGVNKIFMALVLSIEKLLNVSIILVLLLILYGILGVQLFAKNKLSDTLDFHGNFQTFPRAFITLFRSMTGEAWNEMMHDMAKDEADYLMGPKVGDDKSWCSPPKFWQTESVDVYNVLKDKCMIEYPNQCNEYPFFAQIYFVTFCLVITFMVLNLVIAVILEGYEDGKEHTEGEVIDACINMWKKYDKDFTMFIPFTDAFRYSDEVLHTLSPGADGGLQPPSIRPSPTGCCGADLALVPMKYAQAFDLQMTQDGQVHFISVVKLVLRCMTSNNDPDILRELEEADKNLSKKNKDKLEKMETKQQIRNKAVIENPLSLMDQVAASKIQCRFRARQARKKAKQDISRRFGHMSAEEPLVVENVITPAVTPGLSQESDKPWDSAIARPEPQGSVSAPQGPQQLIRPNGEVPVTDVPLTGTVVNPPSG